MAKIYYKTPGILKCDISKYFILFSRSFFPRFCFRDFRPPRHRTLNHSLIISRGFFFAPPADGVESGHPVAVAGKFAIIHPRRF